MTPWWVHNTKAYGTFVRLTPGAGVALYAGNNPLNRSGGGNFGVDYDLSAFANITDPIERDRALRNAAIDYHRAQPETVPGACGPQVPSRVADHTGQ